MRARRRCFFSIKVTGRRSTTSLKISSLFLNILLKFYFISFDIFNFKNSSDQGTPLTCCFWRNQLIDLQIKMHFLLIYTKSLKNKFERVHFSEKFQVIGGGGEIMAGDRWWLQNYGCSWVVGAKLWLVVGGRELWRQSYGWLWVVVDGRTT